jgi:hypothetical protein
MKTVLATAVVLGVAFAFSEAPEHSAHIDASAEMPDSNWQAARETRILGRLNSSTSRSLSCDFVMNWPDSPTNFPANVDGKTTVLLFWRPSCTYCEPILKDLATFVKDSSKDVVVLSAAESSKPEGIAAMVKAVGGVSFPVCGYSDHDQTKRWQAEGVPLTIVFDSRGRAARAAAGSDASAIVAQLRSGWRP